MNTRIPGTVAENSEWRFKPIWDLGSSGYLKAQEEMKNWSPLPTMSWHTVAWGRMAGILGKAVLSMWSKAST